MKNKACVSVVIPAYNQSAYLTVAIESVLSQTYKNYEIIVVDDGSTDETIIIAEKFGQYIRYIRQENQGLAGARNTGIQNAANNLIGLLDADDQWLPMYLEKMTEMAMDDPAAAVYYCSAQAVDKNGKKLPQVLGYNSRHPDDLLDVLLRANFIIPSTVMMNYASIKSGECFDKYFRRLQDWELWIRLLKQGYHFRGSSEILVNYRIHEESLSVDPKGGQLAALSLVTKHFGADDGRPELWDARKRRAYGGTYRYHTLSSLQRQKNWEAGAAFFSKALEVDPTLATDLDFFYDITLSDQSLGYKDAAQLLDIEHVMIAVQNILARVFSHDSTILALRSKVYGTANYAMGLVAYNAGRRSLARNFLSKAIFYRSELLFDKLVVGNILRSFLSAHWMITLKKIF
jgi:glycosyltransferase involved in cell wall biosynthesis